MGEVSGFTLYWKYILRKPMSIPWKFHITGSLRHSARGFSPLVPIELLGMFDLLTDMKCHIVSFLSGCSQHGEREKVSSKAGVYLSFYSKECRKQAQLEG